MTTAQDQPKIMRIGEFMKRRYAIVRSPATKSEKSGAMGRLVHEASATAITKGGNLIGWELPDGKVACRKRRWGIREEAVQKLIDIHGGPTGENVPTHVYECELCNGFHLSRNETATNTWGSL